MSFRIDLDFCHGLAESSLDQSPDGAFQLSLTRGQERVIVHLSLPSLEALWLALTLALSRIGHR